VCRTWSSCLARVWPRGKPAQQGKASYEPVRAEKKKLRQVLDTLMAQAHCDTEPGSLPLLRVARVGCSSGLAGACEQVGSVCLLGQDVSRDTLSHCD
jgi:hypothetical protein